MQNSKRNPTGRKRYRTQRLGIFNSFKMVLVLQIEFRQDFYHYNESGEELPETVFWWEDARPE